MGLLSEIQRRRAERDGEAAASLPSSVLVVSEDRPVGRSVAERLDRSDYHVVDGRIVRRVPLSPWAQRALSRSLPTGGTAPLIDGGDAY
jgi:hypothetical protein